MKLFNPFATLPTYNPIALLSITGIITHPNFKLSDTPDLSGKVAVVTGGQAGIGREITAQLLLHGITKVYILARTESKYNDAKEEWAGKNGLKKDDVETRTEFVQCDLSSIKDVSRAANELLSKLDRLDILINNAALPTIPDYILSPDGIETIFATNHVGHFTLTNILLPLIERAAASAGDARIVNTTSSLHMSCQELDLSQLTSPTRTKYPASFDSSWRYGRSKLANILFTRDLAHRLQKKGIANVYVNCFFPGNIPTDAMDTWKQLFGKVVGKLFKGIFQVIGQSPTDGAATAMFLATSKDVETGDVKGKYFVPIASENKTSPIAEDKDLAKNLWYWTDHQVTEVLGKGWQDVGEHVDTRGAGAEQGDAQ
ncbi:putative short chain dehydrogenase/reductase [Lepidopterella palustris CBS 459.81]|uniref:Putative short chain dehydrogenase/reductase n=1 Tax=Lepidopterella palustris CBS 459.81 TaxID=1314670 RepID=A0A8E2EM24_9PEZI|nr:putative short chain dehydrogenase/reductase [Lepidopterella palustris CBS 459.81]